MGVKDEQHDRQATDRCPLRWVQYYCRNLGMLATLPEWLARGGDAVQTVRLLSDQHERLIRTNPQAPQVFGPRAVGLPLGGLAALEAIGARVLC